LYEVGSRQLLNDPEIRQIVMQRFHKLAELMIGYGTDRVRNASVRDNPFPFPHHDVEMHYGRLYVGSDEGLFALSTESTGQGHKQARQLSDAPAYDIAARRSTMAQACGSAGLIQVDIRVQQGRGPRGVVTKLSDLPCTHCEWAYHSVVAAGQDSAPFVATFKRSDKPANATTGSARFERLLDRIVTGSELFGGESSEYMLSWGAKDKLYRYCEGRIEVVRYTPSGKRKHAGEGEFASAGEIALPAVQSNSKPLSARVAPFGSVLELDAGLFVVPTAGEPIFIPGEPVNWRVFPRSVDYLNHLHIIYEDRLDVWVFTHDYFADQKEKLAGIDVTGSGSE
jgi:hypothetical protein